MSFNFNQEMLLGGEKAANILGDSKEGSSTEKMITLSGVKPSSQSTKCVRTWLPTSYTIAKVKELNIDQNQIIAITYGWLP